MKILLLLSFTLIFSACGKDGIEQLLREPELVYNQDPAQPESYGYQFDERTCSTGVQTFETFIKACNGLVDDKLNKNCAEQERKELFESAKCPGEYI